MILPKLVLPRYPPFIQEKYTTMSRKISIHTFLYLILGLILISAILSFWNRNVTDFTLDDIERSRTFEDNIHLISSELPTLLGYQTLKYAQSKK